MMVFASSLFERWKESMLVVFHLHFDQSLRSTVESDIEF